MLRLRASQERYRSVVGARPRVVTKFELDRYGGDRGMWRLGEPGVKVPLRILRDGRVIELGVPSIDRMRWLRLNQTY